MLQFPLIRFTRKSVWQTFWLGIATAVLAVVWLVGSILATPTFSPDAHAWISLLPFILLMLAATVFLVASVWFFVLWLIGVTGWEDDSPQP